MTSHTPAYHLIASAPSTNSVLTAIAAGSSHGTVVSATEQTAGRGQRGNSWESSPGKNLTLSMLLRPRHIDARSQFFLSEIVSLSIVETLRHYIPNHDIAIKWPNDIYVGDKKICGILIENSLMGMGIDHSIAGIGLNVNQTRFISDAPNPVSLSHITGNEIPLGEIREKLCDTILDMMDIYDDISRFEELHRTYCNNLWRRDGFYPYTTGGETFNARITGVSPTGMLTLTDTAGSSRTFAFKEVSAVL